MKFIDTDGKKRNGIKKKCQSCKQEFITRIDKPSKCCSVKCRYEIRKNKITLTCSTCEKTFQRKPSAKKNSKSGFYFCSRKCKDEAQKIGGIITLPHYGDGKNYRSLFKEEELVCNRCGYNEFISSVDIHHIDHNRENNKKENLIPLCSNCHRAYHNGLITL